MISLSRTCNGRRTKSTKLSMPGPTSWFIIGTCNQTSDIPKLAHKANTMATESTDRHPAVARLTFIMMTSWREALTPISEYPALTIADFTILSALTYFHSSNRYIRSSEDISSGYSSTEPVSMALSRTSSLTNSTKHRPKAKRTEVSLVDIVSWPF